MKLGIMTRRGEDYTTSLAGESWKVETLPWYDGAKKYFARAPDDGPAIELHPDGGCWRGADGEVVIFFHRFSQATETPLLCVAEYGDDAELVHELMNTASFDGVAKISGSAIHEHPRTPENVERFSVAVAFACALSRLKARHEATRRVLWASRARKYGAEIDAYTVEDIIREGAPPPETDTDCEIDIYEDYDTDYTAQEVLL